MGLFSRKKKGTPVSSPASLASSQLLSPPQPVEEPVHVEPPLVISVVLDGWVEGRDAHCLTVEVDKDATISGLRDALAQQLGGMSMGLFKVSIPVLAAKQARAYTERYKLPVDLISSFPSFNIDDTDQLGCSFGNCLLQTAADKANLRVKDWFPEPHSADTIALLVRRADGPSTSIPMSFAVHVAQSGGSSRANRPTTPGGRSIRPAPPIVDILPSTSVAELKSAILRVDHRADEEAERMVVWRVEMSQEEMVVIEERGGLKNGQMPWPYPPTAPVPTAMTDSSLPISHYFPSFHSNGRMVTLSAYLPSSAPSLSRRTLPTEAEHAPAFRYPMILPSTTSEPSSPASCSTTTATIRSPPLATPHQPHSPIIGATPKRPGMSRQRPNTAPAVVVSPNGTPSAPAFGSRRLAVRPVNPSPLVVSTTAKGLGINTDSLQQHRGSTTSHMSAQESEDEGSLPSLDFSLLSFDGEKSGRRGSQSVLNTPVTEKSEWLAMSPATLATPLPGSTTLAVPNQKGLDRVASVGRSNRWSKLVGHR